ncbi:MAG TPA: acetate--CoA ligase family protein [Acidisphaera sp.]|nr:acetate--CoA ligase family protein [Acidisphaera sp.]
MPAQPGARFSALDPLIAPRSVAVVGASDDPRRIGGRPIDFMRRTGFKGDILPVNPNRKTIQGLTAYPSVAALPTTPDVAIIAVPPNLAIEAVRDLGARGVRGAVVFTAGFAEVDEAGAAAQAEMIDAARSSGMRLLGPNCLGLFNAGIGWFATFTNAFDTGFPIPGRIGIASQSGAYGTHLFAAARNRGIGVPLVVTTGNEADVTVGEVIGWMAANADTDVIAAYLEGIREAGSFLAALAAARAARKPVVVMKVGRSALGAAAAQSHTASIAGDDAVTDAVFAEFGVVRARSTEEMLDIAYAATRRIYPAGNTLGVLTISGGAGVLISDAADAAGLAMPPMPEAAQAKLKAMVSFCSPRNPVDATAQVFNDFDLAERFMETMVADGGYRSALAFFSQSAGGPRAPAVRDLLHRLRAAHPDVLFVLSVLAPPEVMAGFDAEGLVVLEDPTRAVNAIAAMGRFGDAFAATPGLPPPVLPDLPLPEAAPDEAEAKRILAAIGITPAPEQACATEDEAVEAAGRIGFPVVLKILSPDIAHKSEIGGVLLGVADAEAVRDGVALLLDRARARAPNARVTGILVARQLRGVECIMGIHRDPVFGPVAVFGLGGVFVEILKDVVIRRCPFGPDVAEQMIASIRGAPLLRGARGTPPADIAALADMLSRLSAFAAAHPRVASIDLNPVIATPDGAYVADALIEVTP